MKKLLELRQEKTALKTQMRSIMDKATDEKRNLNADEGKQFDELRAKAESLDNDISRLEALADEERNQPGKPADGKKVSNDELRHYILTGETRALSTAVGSDGGYTVIPDLDKEIMRQLTDDSVMRQIATVKTTSSNEYKKLVSVGGAVVNHGEEGVARTETSTPKLEEVSIKLFPIYAYPKTTQEILDFSDVDILGWLSSEISDTFTETEETDLLTGDGSKKAKGFLSYPRAATGDKTRPFGTLEKMETAGASPVADELIDLLFKLKAKYRKNAVWVMNSNSAAALQKLKNGNGDYIWRDRLTEGSPDLLLGRPVYYLENMSDAVAGEPVLAVGDFSLAIVDEYHLHPDNGVYSALELGMGARPEGILFAITTAGSNVVSACKQHYDYCCQILAGEESNESLFALIYELDDESEIDDPALWVKANPNLDISVDGAALADTIQKARGIPSQWVEMLTKRFNIWCQGATPWMGSGAWDACKDDYSESDLAGMECYAGLDLSSTGDITSVCYAFPSDREIRLLTRHYLPEAQLNNVANKNRAIYRQWAKAGWIRTTPGDCIDYDRIRDDILRDAEVFGIKLVGFDAWNATHLRTQLQGAGLDVEPFPQTYLKFSPVAKSLEVFVNRKVIRHNGDPVLAWAIGNVVMESDANANIKPNKKKSANKIDPAIAGLMAFGTWQAEHEDFSFDMSEAHKQRLATFTGI